MPRVLGVADSLKNHIVALLQGNIADVLHGLHEGNYFAESLLRRVLLMHRQRVLMVDVVARPEVLTEHPREYKFGEAPELEGLVREHAGASLLGEVAVPKHGRVRIIVGNTTALALGGVFEAHACYEPVESISDMETYLLRKDILL